MKRVTIPALLVLSVFSFVTCEVPYSYSPSSLPLSHAFLHRILANHSFLAPVEEVLRNYPRDTPTSLRADKSDLCVAKIKEYARKLEHQGNESSEAAGFFDALGKPPSGILRGNLLILGSYDSCIQLQQSTNSYFKPCKISATMKIKGVPAPIVWTTCFPAECRDGNFTRLKDTIVKDLNRDPKLLFVEKSSIVTTCKVVPSYSVGAYIAVVTVSVVLFCVTVGSLWEPVVCFLQAIRRNGSSDTTVLVNCEEEPTSAVDENIQRQPSTHSKEPLSALGQFFTCFAVQRTFPGLFSTATKPGQILSLNGIRVLSINWVVLGHVYYIGINVGDLTVFRKVYGRLATTIIYNAFPSVDTFLYLSGFLVSYLLLKELSRRGGTFNVLGYYVHRYIRLTAPYLLVILVQGFLVPVYLTGPFSEIIEQGHQMCKDWWWTNLLYINNLVPWNKVRICVGQSWYLSNDMQFFIIAPLFIVLLYRKPLIGLLVTTGTWACSALLAGGLTYYEDFGPTPVFELVILFAPAFSLFPFSSHNYLLFSSNGVNMTQFRMMYVKPWIRVPPYLIGILGGWLFYKYRNTMQLLIGRLSLIKKLAVGICIWGISCSIQYAVVFGLHHDMLRKLDDQSLPTTSESVSYETLARSGWGIALTLQIIACETGLGGIVGQILSWKVWLVFSRLTYAVYLVHFILIQTLVAQLRHAFYFAPDYEVAIIYLGCLAMSYAFAVLLYTFLEQPLSYLERLTYRKPTN